MSARSRMLARVEAGPPATLKDCFSEQGRALVPRERALPVGAFVEASRVADGEETVLLATSGSSKARLYELLVELGVQPVFPDAVHHEVDEIVAEPRLEHGTDDLRHWPFVTIDNDDSRDLDQALLIERLEGQEASYRLHYALADAAFYVRPGTALFDEALLRGATFYLPGFAVPMLPPPLSEGIVSLNPEVERRALVFSIDLAADASPLAVALRRGRIRSQAKLSYRGVQAYYDAPEESELSGRDFEASLQLLREVGELRIAAAEARGVVDYDRRELELSLDEAGALRPALRVRLPVERYNEQISLLCNTEGAALLLAHADDPAAQPIFRIHPPPLPGRLDELEQAIGELAKHHGLDDRWRWRRQRKAGEVGTNGAQRLGDYLRALPSTPERPRRAIASLVRHVNRASTFEAGPAPHHALRVEAYARFSAPMREIVGVFTHKEAIELLGLREGDSSRAIARDEALRQRAIAVANEAKRKQRWLGKKSEELAIEALLRGDLALALDERPTREATVVGVSGSRLYVDLDDFAVTLKLYAWDLEETFQTGYHYDGFRLCAEDPRVAPSFALGDGISLKTRGFDRRRGRWAFFPAHL